MTDTAPAPALPTLQRLTARYRGTCQVCGERIAAGSTILYDRATKSVYHDACQAALTEPAPIDIDGVGETLPTRGETFRNRRHSAGSSRQRARQADTPEARQARIDAAASAAAAHLTAARAAHPEDSAEVRQARDRHLDALLGRTTDAGADLPADDGPAFLTVVRITSRWLSRDAAEDMDEFTIADRGGYVYTLHCRPATAAEAAPLLAAETERAALATARARMQAIANQIKDTGERPWAERHQSIHAVGERLLDTQNLYGGGDWFVVGPEAGPDAWLWYVRNNGHDGDDWSQNNVRTGGAGAIGWRIPYDPALADELRRLDTTLTGKDDRHG